LGCCCGRAGSGGLKKKGDTSREENSRKADISKALIVTYIEKNLKFLTTSRDAAVQKKNETKPFTSTGRATCGTPLGRKWQNFELISAPRNGDNFIMGRRAN